MRVTADDDEFDSVAIGQCSAIYHYAARQDDELSIEPGLIALLYLCLVVSLQCFDAVSWAIGRASGAICRTLS